MSTSFCHYVVSLFGLDKGDILALLWNEDIIESILFIFCYCILILFKITFYSMLRFLIVIAES